MLKRQFGIVVILVWILAACGGAPTPDRTDITVPAIVATDPLDDLDIDPNALFVLVNTQLTYATNNPGARWSTVGPRLNPIGDFTTTVDLDILGNFVGEDADLEELLPEYTVSEMEIKETEDGNIYAEGLNVVDIPEIFMIKSGYMMRFSYNEGAAPPRTAYEDFVIIATTGELIELD